MPSTLANSALSLNVAMPAPASVADQAMSPLSTMSGRMASVISAKVTPAPR
jgi:hypothetical protein